MDLLDEQGQALTATRGATLRQPLNGVRCLQIVICSYLLHSPCAHLSSLSTCQTLCLCTCAAAMTGGVQSSEVPAREAKVLQEPEDEFLDMATRMGVVSGAATPAPVPLCPVTGSCRTSLPAGPCHAYADLLPWPRQARSRGLADTVLIFCPGLARRARGLADAVLIFCPGLARRALGVWQIRC